MKRTQKKVPATPAKPLRIIIADDHVLTRESLFSMVLQTSRRSELVAEASSVAETLSVIKRFAPDLLLLDVDTPGGSRAELVPEIKRIAPATRILLYCSAVNGQDVLTALHAGADGYLEKTCNRSDFLEAIDRVANGGTYLCPKTVNALAKSLRRRQEDGAGDQGQRELTPREKEIVALIAAGASSKEVAKKLFLSVSTIETHRANLMRKMGARNVAQLVHYALQHGLVNASSTS